MIYIAGRGGLHSLTVHHKTCKQTLAQQDRSLEQHRCVASSGLGKGFLLALHTAQLCTDIASMCRIHGFAVAELAPPL